MADSKIGNKRLIKKQLEDVYKKEARLLNKTGLKFIEDKIAPMQEKIEDKIPKKLEETLEKAFVGGFKTVFNNGVGVIEKSYNKE